MMLDAMPAPRVRLGAPLDCVSPGYHNGPGMRFSLWTQGCSLRCTANCLNPHLLAAAGGHDVAAVDLAYHLLRLAKLYPEAEGVTVLGGEPFDQAAALAAALAPVRTGGLSIMIYSGQGIADLSASSDPGVVALLSLADLLVDGPFRDDLYDETLVWRGSTNQRVLLLTERYARADVDAAMERQGKGASMTWRPDGGWMVSGAQSRASARLHRLAARAPRPRSDA